jgi:uncharacterized protein (DUF169 family)
LRGENNLFDKEVVKVSITKANCALDLERRIVAMKFLFTKKEFKQADAPQLKSKMPYCSMIERATTGEKMKADFSNFGCFGGARALGIVERDEFYLSGRRIKNRGLYHDLATSKEVTKHTSSCQHKTYGLQVMPLVEFNDDPDIVLVISNPNNIMRLVQGYTHYFGTHDSFKMFGNQAICSECTAHPFETNDINISVLCSGARLTGMKDYELAMGLPFNRFEKVVDGLCMTITPIESDNVKIRIMKKLKENNITDVRIILNQNYAKPFFARDYSLFSMRLDHSSLEEEELLPDIWQSDGLKNEPPST